MGGILFKYATEALAPIDLDGDVVQYDNLPPSRVIWDQQYTGLGDEQYEDSVCIPVFITAELSLLVYEVQGESILK